MKENNNNSSGLPLGMCIGLSIGTAIGAATHNIGLWMPIGISVGMCLGLLLGHKSGSDNEDDKSDKKQAYLQYNRITPAWIFLPCGCGFSGFRAEIKAGFFPCFVLRFFNSIQKSHRQSFSRKLLFRIYRLPPCSFLRASDNRHRRCIRRRRPFLQ